MKLDFIIVGAGIAGITLARRLAEEKDAQILIIERRQHIGGYCYDYLDESGIYIHQYGPHIFRTDNKMVYDYLSRFTNWYDYQHKVLSYVGGKYYPMPINLDTVNLFLGQNYNTQTVLNYFKENRTNPNKIISVKDSVESQIGPLFYKSFFENYTIKQWGIKPEDLPAEVIARIPIRNNRDDRYFTTKYQGIPQNGYTLMLQNVLKHPNIHLLLNTDYKEVKTDLKADHIYYSGSIDEYHDYCLGKLPYRSVDFVIEKYSKMNYQPVAVVNFPNDYDYTRITEYKHFTDTSVPHTIIAKEFPSDNGDPSYPIPLKDNIDLYNRYVELDKDKKVTYIGRLGLYKYFSMDQIIENIYKMII